MARTPEVILREELRASVGKAFQFQLVDAPATDRVWFVVRTKDGREANHSVSRSTLQALAARRGYVSGDKLAEERCRAGIRKHLVPWHAAEILRKLGA